MTQLDLFDAPPCAPWSPDSEADRLGWESRLLQDLADGPRVYCFPGFTGAICERLVAKGLVSKEARGQMAAPEWIKTPADRRWFKASGPHPQFEYRIALTTTSQVAAA
jgi:hypothetical protein